MSVSNDAIWYQWCASLTNLLSSRPDPKVQQISFAGTSLVVDLVDSIAAVDNTTVYQLGNTIPAASPAYVPMSDLVSTYATFLDYIQLAGDPNPNLQSQINAAAAALTAAQTNFTTQLTAALAQWTTYTTATGSKTPFSQWAAAYYPVYAEARSALSGAEANYQQLLIQAYGPGYSVIADARDRVGLVNGARDAASQTSYNMPIQSGSVAPINGTPVLPGQTPPPPDSATVPGYAPLYSLNGFASTYPVWQTDSTNKKVNVGPITVAASSSTQDWSAFGWSGSAQASFGDFFRLGVGGSTSGQKVSVDTTSTSYKLEVSFTDMGTFLLSPGTWYQSGIVQTYKGQLKSGAPTFLGATGSMGRVPYAVVLGFEPTIRMTMASADYHSLQTQWKANAQVSVGIGPFTLGSASVTTYGSSKDVQFDDSSCSITVGPVKGTMPYLLAVISTQVS